MRGIIYCLFTIQSRTMQLQLPFNYEGSAFVVVACDDFLLCLISSLLLLSHSYLPMIIVCDVNKHIIVQSDLVFTAYKVIDIFLFILPLYQ